MTKKLLVIGAGGHGKVVADIACDMDCWDEICFLDDQFPAVTHLGIWKVIGQLEEIGDLGTEYADAVVAIGDNRVRVEWLEKCMKLGYGTPIIRHPSASVSRMAEIGPGSVLVAQSAINADAVVGMGGIVNTGATVGHDCILAEGVHIAPGVNLAGGATVGSYSWIGIGSKVLQKIRIGRDVIVGAGAVIIRDLPDGVTVVGVPARVLNDSCRRSES